METGQRITKDVTITKMYEFVDYKFDYNGTPRCIYTMEDADGNVYVWKTTTVLCLHNNSDDSRYDDVYVAKKGDKITISGTVKGHDEYNGVNQTILTRVKLLGVIEKALTWEEKKALKQKEQMETLKGDDFVWTMSYKQYKEHYADCETLYGSFEESRNGRFGYIPAQITVIIREGRLKNSGVRGEHFSGYRLKNEDGEIVTYRAVNEENAIKRADKEHPNHVWKCVKVFVYDREA